MTERMASGADDRLEAGYREPKDLEKDSVSRDREATVQIWGDITKESEENAKWGVERGLRGASEMYGEENIISAVIHVDETRPICIVILRRWPRGGSGTKTNRWLSLCLLSRYGF